jgi:hypothetical protein
MPNYGYGWQTGAGRIDRTLFDEGLRQHMLRVYNYMGLGLVSTGCLEDNTFLCAEIGHGPFRRSRGHSGKRRVWLSPTCQQNEPVHGRKP